MISQVRATEPGADGTPALESGDVLWLRDQRFELGSREQPLLSSAVLASGKNVSYDPASGAVGGSAPRGGAAESLRGMLARYSDEAEALAGRLLPAYRGRVRRGRTSFRPVE